MTTATIDMPAKLQPVFRPRRGALRYRGAYGGRGSGKSYNFALMAALWGAQESLRVLATREFQESIKESFYAELERVIIDTPELTPLYNIGESYIRGYNGTNFIFKGLRRNINSIRSMAKIDLAIVEESEDVPENSWRDLIPTIRTPKSEIWVIWNPRGKNSPVDKRFRQQPPHNAAIAEMNYPDNPFFPEVLEEERQRDLELLDPATYAHIWEGAYQEHSVAQVLKGKVRVAEFSPGPDWGGPYYGLDFGFSGDPTAAVECYVHDKTLYIHAETGGVRMELDDTPDALKEAFPGIEKYVIRAENARPESVSYIARHGLPRIVSVKKWPGSVEDGVQHLRSYREIVIHPRCRETIKESRFYSYKVDKHTGDVLPEIVDAWNHYMDATRYAIQPVIRGGAAKPRVRRRK